MNKTLTLAIAAILLLTYSSGAFAKSSCATDEEIKALNARVLQSDLMVAALSCKQQPSYNAFVKKYQSELIRRSSSVQGYFKRVYGKSSEYQLNRFITNVANDSSTTSLRINESSFCGSAKDTFSKVLASSSRDLTPLVALDMSNRHGVPPCKSVAQN